MAEHLNDISQRTLACAGIQACTLMSNAEPLRTLPLLGVLLTTVCNCVVVIADTFVERVLLALGAAHVCAVARHLPSARFAGQTLPISSAWGRC